MTVSISYRSGLIALFVILGLSGALVIVAQLNPSRQSASIPPAQVIVQQAAITSQGVRINWLPAQAGSRDIAGYSVERSRSNGTFVLIGHTENTSNAFIDNEGQAGDRYRIIAEDNQRPALRSLVSDETVAAPPPAGQTIAVAANSSAHVLGVSSTKDITALQRGLSQSLSQLELITDTNSTNVANITDTAEQYQRRVLITYPEFSAVQKQAFADICARHAGSLESASRRIPEDLNFEILLLQANCQAISEAS